MEYLTGALDEQTQLAAKIAIVLVAYVIYRQDFVVNHTAKQNKSNLYRF